MNKRIRKKTSKIHKKLTRSFRILYDLEEDSHKELDLYKDIYYNAKYPYVLFNEDKWDLLCYMLKQKGYDFKNEGEEFPIFWAIYNNKIPVYLEKFKVMQYEKNGRVIESLTIRNDEKDSILSKISDFFILSKEQGNSRYFPKHNKADTLNYRLESITFLFKGYTFEMIYQSRIRTNAPNHIIDKLVKQTSFFGYLRTDQKKKSS